jgi:hypothetical protein
MGDNLKITKNEVEIHLHTIISIIYLARYCYSKQ